MSILILSTIIINIIQESLIITFVSNKLFGQLYDIPPKKHLIQKILNSEFLYIEVWFTDESSKLLEIEDKRRINLFSN